MREADGYNEAVLSMITLDEFVPATHPPWPIRE